MAAIDTRPVNPFADDTTASRTKTSRRSPPQVPSKSSSMPVPTSQRSRDSPHRDITEAVKDTVTVRGSEHSSSSRKMARSHSQVPSPQSASPRPGVPGRRSQSQDSVLVAAAAVEKAKGKRTKKGSQHADVIDRLDFTGVGSMFHHDGPFDACAPSRNRHRMKAPMLAWSSGDPAVPAPNNDSAYPSMADTYTNNYQQPKKKVDAIAEAWGTHEPEPFEEFSAGGGRQGDTPASSIYNGRSGHRAPATEPVPSSARRAASRRSALPPPQPIFVPDESDGIDQPLGSPPLVSPNLHGPKRSKSLMHRIRKMRDAPNVPVGYDETPTPTTPGDHNSPEQARPGHRSQNSFLGMFNGSRNHPMPSPPEERPEAFVLVEDSKSKHSGGAAPAAHKDLPATPTDNGTNGYFEGGASGGRNFSTGTPGLGRKASLMKKMKGVVRGK